MRFIAETHIRLLTSSKFKKIKIVQIFMRKILVSELGHGENRIKKVKNHYTRPIGYEQPLYSNTIEKDC